ncbi:MAG: ATP-binding protein, partial [Variovorax sp.]
GVAEVSAGEALAPTRRVHPIVKLDYGVRAVAHLSIGAATLSVFIERPPSQYVWAALVFTTFVWAHLAYQVSSRARDTKRAELRNLLGDALIVGAWSAICGFDTWLTVCFFVAIGTANLSVGGLRFAVTSTGVFILSALVAGWATGFDLHLQASALTQALITISLILFNIVFGLQSHLQTRSAIRANREIREHTRLIEQQSRELEEARQSAELERQAADAARLQAEAANRTKSAFLANMSHELRTPLNAVIGYTEMVQEDLADHPQFATAKNDLGRVKSAAKHLLGLINDVLDLSKIEADKVEVSLEDFEIAALVDQVASTCAPLVHVNRNRFEFHIDRRLGRIHSDAGRLRQVLCNLVSNAAKFTNDGRIRLDVTPQIDARGRALVQFDVSDTGIGLAPAQLARLFQAFVQAEAHTARKYGGTGLGLTISRHLCRLLGGDVTATSAVGQGSCFRATVLAEQPEPSVPTGSAAV